MSVAYQLEYVPDAVTDLAQLDPPVARRILDKLQWLAANFDVIRHEPLAGEWSGFYKLRVGDYRAIYTANRTQRIVTVHVIRHRRDVYQ
jgi:mRNA interferase RelE/StbE